MPTSEGPSEIPKIRYKSEVVSCSRLHGHRKRIRRREGAEIPVILVLVTPVFIMPPSGKLLKHWADRALVFHGAPYPREEDRFFATQNRE